MNFWNNLRAQGINLYERFCIECRTKKSISHFPKHLKYKKSKVCFECLGEIKCLTCKQTKSYNEFKDRYSGRRKSKTECWQCYIEKTNRSRRENYAKKKLSGELKIIDRSKLPMHSLLWAKISSKKSNTNNINNTRSSTVEITSKEFKKWFEKNYEGNCYYCEVTLDEYRSSKFLKRIRPHIKNFGIDRKNTKLGYSLNNIVIACNLCNSVKGSFFDHIEFKEIAKKYIKKLYE